MVAGEARNSWSDIPPGLLEEILRKLPVVDYLHCRRVCRSWRHAVRDAVATRGRTCPPAPQFPFLMSLPRNFEINKHATLLDTMQKNTSYTIPTQTWKVSFEFDRVFSVQGWLVLQKICYSQNEFYDSIVFSNPVSGKEFELPDMPLFQGQHFTDQPLVTSVKLVFSCAPPPDSSDFLVVACAITTPKRDQSRMQRAFCKVADK